GKLSLEPECFSLGEITRDVLNRFGPALQQARCEVQLSLNSEARGNWDRSRVEQIVTNLLTNAAKYGAGAPIEIEVVEENGSGVLRVKDHGIGIAPEDQKRIFIQFERAASAMNFSGLGLGLYIVHQIVEAHGGRISVESRLGEGSTFTVHLPQNTQPGLETAAQRGGEGSEASASEPRGKAIHADG
ncbi:MAG: sensor histidine kinase, partial [Bdellovibrionota bacterium]